MTVIQVRATGSQAIHPQWPRRRLHSILEPALANVPTDSPIVIYVQGHQDWPPDDILVQARANAGLSITFSWPAAPPLMGVVPDVGQLYQQAGDAAQALAGLINLLAALAPDHRIDLMGHSLGARTSLMALHHVKQNNIARLICLAAVEFSAITLWALQAPAARHIAFFNITDRHTSLFHRLMHHFGPRPGPADRLLCRGFAFPRANWVDICLDNPTVRRPLARLCAERLGLPAGLKAPPLITQLEAVFLQDRRITGIPQMRDMLGTAIPEPLSIIPVRMPPRRFN